MHLTKNGVTIQMDDSAIVQMALERLAGSEYPLDLRGIVAPRIGDEWHGQGGIYAGIARGIDGASDYHLIVGPEADEQLTWDAGIEFAKRCFVAGTNDFALPRRKEQALMFANVPELFREEHYWSGEQHADVSAYAWIQNFNDGSQLTWHKNIKLRVRAVRRLVIQ